MAADGLITVARGFAARETVDRLEAEVRARGSMTVFARIDHSAGAAEVDLPLQPTELLILGNATGSTPFMQATMIRAGSLCGTDLGRLSLGASMRWRRPSTASR
jgi:uncharacterized protein (DUF302 family)